MYAGLLSGTPTQVGTFNFTVTANDGSNCTASQAYSLQIIVPVQLQSLTVE